MGKGTNTPDMIKVGQFWKWLKTRGYFNIYFMSAPLYFMASLTKPHKEKVGKGKATHFNPWEANFNLPGESKWQQSDHLRNYIERQRML